MIRGTASYKHACMMLYILFEIYRINFIIAFSWREFLENRTHILKMAHRHSLFVYGWLYSCTGPCIYMHTRSFH